MRLQQTENHSDKGKEKYQKQRQCYKTRGNVLRKSDVRTYTNRSLLSAKVCIGILAQKTCQNKMFCGKTGKKLQIF